MGAGYQNYKTLNVLTGFTQFLVSLRNATSSLASEYFVKCVHKHPQPARCLPELLAKPTTTMTTVIKAREEVCYAMTSVSSFKKLLECNHNTNAHILPPLINSKQSLHILDLAALVTGTLPNECSCVKI
uniref:Uncharacterized protein n=1 Tax=Glossina pallidipes TaxID=7398 RepID=A0A1A9Z0P4_GLOPL